MSTAPNINSPSPQKDQASNPFRVFYKFLQKIQARISNAPSSYLAYSFIIPIALMYAVYLAMELHPFGDGTILVLDLNGQYVYFHEALRNLIYGHGSFLYTFSRSLGGEFFGMYAYYLASPLSYIVALFPRAAIQEAMLTIILLKVGSCGLSFGFYLHKNTASLNRPIIVAFSVMYALCAYAVVYQNNLMWIDALIWLPILTYSIEQLIKNKRYKLFVISLAMTIMSNYYIGYMVCIYVAIYFFYYCFANDTNALNPHGEKMHLSTSFLRIIIYSFLAIAISAFTILAAYYSLTFGKTTFSSTDWSFITNFSFLDLLTKFLPGAYDTVEPNGLPWVYCGILTLIALPIYFMSKKISTREKIASLVFIAIFLLSFIISPLDLIWHGFQVPNWLNYRYSFMLSFFLLIIAYKGVGNMRRVGEKFILGISAFIILFVCVCDKLTFETYIDSENSLKTFETVWLTVISTIVILTVLCVMIRQKRPKLRENVSGVLLAVICIEIFFSSLSCIVGLDKDVSFSTYSSYDNFIGPLHTVTDELNEYDSSFYRAEKIMHRKYNDNMALGLRGLSNSTSTLNAETLIFLDRMGYASRSHLSQYLGGTPVNDSLLGIKYVIDYSSSDRLKNYYTPAFTSGNYTVYKNPYALSLAYGVDNDITKLDLSKYPTAFEKLNAFTGAVTGNEEIPDIFRSAGTYGVTMSQACSAKKTGNKTTYSIAMNDSAAVVNFTIEAKRNAEYYFYPPSFTLIETKVFVNGVERGKYLGHNNCHILPLGYFEDGDSIQVSIQLKEDSITLYNDQDYFWYIDKNNFEKAFSTLAASPQFIIDENYKEDHLRGTITTQENDQTILTTIPYDEGWKIYLDGKQVEIYKSVDALITFDISESGTHSLEMRYSPTVYRVGAIISMLGLAIFIVLCLSDLRKKIKLQKISSDTTSISNEKWVLEDFSDNTDLDNPQNDQKEKITLKEYLSVFSIFNKDKNNKDQIRQEDNNDKE